MRITNLINGWSEYTGLKTPEHVRMEDVVNIMIQFSNKVCPDNVLDALERHSEELFTLKALIRKHSVD